MPSVPEIITSNIIEQLERGVAPWRKPWSTSIPRNLTSKKPYRGLNVFLLATHLGRFNSPDPLGGDIGDPQTLNRYAYVRNNPLTLTDPTGMLPGDGPCDESADDCSGLGI